MRDSWIQGVLIVLPALFSFSLGYFVGSDEGSRKQEIISIRQEEQTRQSEVWLIGVANKIWEKAAVDHGAGHYTKDGKFERNNEAKPEGKKK
jgi:hypothetical protein